MKVFTKSSNALKITDGNGGSTVFWGVIDFVGNCLLGVSFGAVQGDGVGFSCGFVLVVVCGLSSILTEETLREGEDDVLGE